MIEAASVQQQQPKGGGQSVTDLVIRDLNARRELGISRYGQELLTNNGRNPMVDAYQEILDLACYFRQKLTEEGLL